MFLIGFFKKEQAMGKPVGIEDTGCNLCLGYPSQYVAVNPHEMKCRLMISAD